MCRVFFFNDTATTEIYTLSLHDALPISRGVDAEDRVQRRDGPIRPERELRARVEQRAEGVGGLDALRADALLQPAPVVDRVVGLHRRNHSELPEQGDVLRPEVLRVLHAEPAITRAVGPGHAVVDREQNGIGAVADAILRSEEHTLNSSHLVISYAVFCLKKKKKINSRKYRLLSTHE